MTHIATMGTSSCATISIGGFKDSMGGNPIMGKQANEDYKKDPKNYNHKAEFTVANFRDEILYPTQQELGKTSEYPFEKLMEELENTDMRDKFCIATLNNSQETDGYWPSELERWGFVRVDETNNNWGSKNHVYLRNRSRPSHTSVKKESSFV